MDNERIPARYGMFNKEELSLDEVAQRGFFGHREDIKDWFLEATTERKIRYFQETGYRPTLSSSVAERSMHTTYHCHLVARLKDDLSTMVRMEICGNSYGVRKGKVKKILFVPYTAWDEFPIADASLSLGDLDKVLLGLKSLTKGLDAESPSVHQSAR